MVKGCYLSIDAMTTSVLGVIWEAPSFVAGRDQINIWPLNLQWVSLWMNSDALESLPKRGEPEIEKLMPNKF